MYSCDMRLYRRVRVQTLVAGKRAFLKRASILSALPRYACSARFARFFEALQYSTRGPVFFYGSVRLWCLAKRRIC